MANRGHRFLRLPEIHDEPLHFFAPEVLPHARRVSAGKKERVERVHVETPHAIGFAISAHVIISA